jgi:hypothetical protein
MCQGVLLAHTAAVMLPVHTGLGLEAHVYAANHHRLQQIQPHENYTITREKHKCQYLQSCNTDYKPVTRLLLWCDLWMHACS